MQVRINNVDYDCVEGAVYTRNYNETLDSMEIRIAHLTSRLDIEPYDTILIKGVGDDFYMCVDSWVCQEENLDPIFYTYEISLFSVVKKLENIILPNLAITPNSENRSLLYYMQQYVREYGDGEWEFSQSGLDRFANIPCPEMQWNTPTLREVLNDLMMVDDCICTIEGRNYIACIDLTVKRSEIDTSTCNYIRRSMSSQDYVSEIRMDLQNAVQSDAAVITERLPFTVSDEFGTLTTTQNFVIKTQYPIANIKHLWLDIYCSHKVFPSGAYKDQLIRIDLVNIFDEPLVREYQEYVTLPLLFKPQLAVLNVTKDNIYQYQNFCLYFNRYGTTIEGLNKVITTTAFANSLLFNIIIFIAHAKIYNESGPTSDDYLSTWNISACEIEYETVQNIAFSARKMHKTKNKRVIMDNQTNSFVNVKVQGDLEYQKVNRLGNEQLMINQRVESFDDVITLAQTYQDSIVYQTQYQIYTDHIETNALATKKYILQNYFTGIKSHIRTWVNARDEAVTRHELIKDSYRLSYTRTDTTNNNWLFLQPLLQDFFQHFDTFYIEGETPTKWCALQTFDENGNAINTDLFMVDLIIRKLKNSIVFTFGCDTNSYVYKYIDTSHLDAANDVSGLTIKSSYLSDYGGVPLQFKTYVDDKYENYGIRFAFIYKINRGDEYISNGHGYEIYEISNNWSSYVDNNSFKTPMHVDCVLMDNTPISSTYYLLSTFEKRVSYHKDNREISQYSYQLEFLCDEDMIIGDKFVEYQQLVRENGFAFKYYKASKLSDPLPANKIEITDMVVADYDEYDINAVQYTTSQATQNDYIYVCDGDNNIIIAFKYKQDTIYLNKE